MIPNQKQAFDSKRHRPAPRGRFLAIVGLLGIASIVIFSWIHEQPAVIDSKIASPISTLARDVVGDSSALLADSRFTVTSNRLPPYLQLRIPGSPPKSKVSQKSAEIRWQFQTPRPDAQTFSPHPPARCSIHGLLGQCTDATGVRFVIAKEVSAGSVTFGHSNTLRGSEWAKAFTGALQNHRPEWWDMTTRKFRRENLVMLTQDGRTVLVLPAEMEAEFRRRGFKDFRWSF